MLVASVSPDEPTAATREVPSPDPGAPGPAEARRARRRGAVPAIRYPADLPITAERATLLAVLRDHQVVIVAGETGSGKSTQLPKLCLELGRGVDGMIGHTQPRRVAARSVAERIAHELGTEVGAAVGYAVRFTDRVGDDTLVKVMTDGILLAEIRRDRRLARYDTIIVDEAHERSLNIDFLLGYLTRLLPSRPDLKVIITSATIDTERFARHFGDAPVVEVSGRTHPVEVRYRPFGEEPDDERDQPQAICDAVAELAREGPGDVLVFLSGEREIRDAAEALRRLELPDVELLALYARLSSAEQHRIFEAHRGRRVVLATNIAETSITVPGVRYVVDAGTARISRYSHRLKVQRLPIERVSKASADQRAGRCGRVAPGVCIRLYSEDDYDARPDFTEPEILRTNLASVILQMSAIGLGDVAAFPFVDPPDARSVSDGVALLEELGAFAPKVRDPQRRLTPLGRRLARLPIDPRLGRMVLEAERHGCLREVMVIAAGLSIQDPRERPAGAEQAAAELHGRFADDESDFLTLVHLWDYLRQQQRALSSTQFRKLCRAEHLHYLRVREWQDLYSQLRHVVADLGLRVATVAAHPDHVHRALLAGLLSQVGMRDGTSREYRGARNARFAIARGSVLAKKPPRWVMAAELVETSRLWARRAARIDPEWIESVGAHLVRRTYSEPHWDAGRGEVVAFERVTLYGLPVVASRRVGYGRIDPGLCRELFIRHALVDGDWHGHHAFVADNRALVEQVRSWEERARRHDLLVDDETLVEFFDARIPADVTSVRHFDRWWKRQRPEQPDRLHFTLDLLVDPSIGPDVAGDFPEVWEQDGLALALTYEHAPGSPTDGVSVHVPLDLLPRVRSAGFDWHVPGHREELVTALIRTLPKPVRRHVLPVAEHARAFLAEAEPGDEPLVEAMARVLGRLAGQPIPASEFRPEDLPAHLRPTFVVDDVDGHPVAFGKDLDLLRRRLAPRTRAAIASAAGAVERTGQRAWTFGTLPRTVEIARDGRVVTAHPALVDEGETVGVRVFATEAHQQAAMRVGTRRLLALQVGPARKAVLGRLSRDAKLGLAHAPHPSVSALLDDCIDASIDALVRRHGGPAWDEAGFGALARAVEAEVVAEAAATATAVAAVLAAARDAEARLEQLTGLGAAVLEPALADARTQLASLVYPGFVRAVGADHVADLARYVRAIDRRLEKLPDHPGRDRDLMARVHDLERERRAVRDRLEPLGRAADADAVRWMLEELRVSFFAQALGTAVPVSEQRVRRELRRIERATG